VRNRVLWLRISSIVSLLFAVGHTLGGRRAWSPVGENEVLASMRTVHFDVQGVSRSFLDFYRGFGYSLTVFLLLQAVLLWQLAAIARTQAQTVRPLVASFAIASVVGGLIAWVFLFPTPAVFSALLTACLIIAFFTLR
jgi:hypothetical protein